MAGQITTVILVAVVLGLDAFSLALGMGTRGVPRSYEIKFAASVAVFHILMPLTGLYLGMAVGNILGVWAGRLGAAILIYMGIMFVIKGYRELQPRAWKFNEADKAWSSGAAVVATGLVSMMIMTFSVSVDALTVGFSLGTFQMPPLLTALVTGTAAGSMTLLGFAGGRLFNRVMGSYAGIAGGIILAGLAVRLLT